MKNLLFPIFIITILASACDKNEPTPSGQYSNGVFVVNEGIFNTGSGSISFFDPTSSTVSNGIFQQVNGFPLGNVVQSMANYGDDAFVVVNNANKLVRAHKGSMEFVAEISGIPQPRYFVKVSDSKGYVSCWGNNANDGMVAVIDLDSNKVDGFINVGRDPERMVLAGNKLYVACGGYSFGAAPDNRVFAINITTDLVESQITVGDIPSDVVVLGTKVWVLAYGKKVYDASWNIDLAQSTASSLALVNPITGTIERTLTFPDVSKTANLLQADASNNRLFYQYSGSVYAFEVNNPSLPTSPFVNRPFNSLYGLGVDTNRDQVYCADARDYASAGRVFRFTNLGVLIDSFNVGVIPNGFVFD